MLQRLQSIKRNELGQIYGFVNDVTVGWDVCEISKSEVSELMTMVVRKLINEDFAIPNQVWNSWIYVFGFENDKKRFKSLADFGSSQRNRMDSIKKFLKETDPLVLSFQDREHVEGLYCFLLDSTKTSSDVYTLLNHYLLLNKRLVGPKAWCKFLVKLMYYKDSPVDTILNLLYRMIVKDEITPNEQLVKVFQKFLLDHSVQGLTPSGIDVLHKLEKDLLYNMMLVGMVDASQFEQLMSFIEYMNSIRKQPCSLVSGYIIKSLFKARKYTYGFQLIRHHLGEFPNAKHGVKTKVYEEIMDACRIAKLYHYVLYLFLHCKRYGLKRTSTMGNILLCIYLRRGNMKKAFETARVLKSLQGGMTSVTSREYIVALKRKSVEEAQAFLNGLFQSGAMDIVLYKTAIQNSLTLPGLETPQDIFVHMIRNNVRPDRMFFMVWMKRLHLVDKDLEAVEELFKLSKEYFYPNIHTYNFMISVYLSHGLYEKSMGILEKMEKDGILPDKYTYTTFMMWFLKSGDRPKALEYYGKLIGYDFEAKRTKYLSPREQAGGDVIETMLRHCDINEQSKLLFITLRCGLRPTRSKLFSILFDLIPQHPWSSVLIPLVDQKYQTLLLERCLHRSWGFSIHQLNRDMLKTWSSWEWSKVHADLVQKVKLGHPFDEYVLYRSIAKRLNIEIPHHRIPSPTKAVIDDFLNRFFDMTVEDALPIWKRPPQELKPIGRTDIAYQEEIQQIAKPLLEPQTPPRVETVSTIAQDMLPVLHTAVALYKDIKGKK